MKKYVDRLVQDGHCFVPAEAQDLSAVDDTHILQRAFRNKQQIDPAAGRRWRTHAKMKLAGDMLELLPHTGYIQSEDYNPDAKGEQREFAPIPDDVIESRALQHLVDLTISIGREALPDVFEGNLLQVGLHMVSYRPDAGAWSWASPLSFHRDQEAFVAVTLLGLSHNLGGGENAITADRTEILDHISMKQAFDTLLLTKRNFHTVFPMYSTDGRPAYRDIILVTCG